MPKKKNGISGKTEEPTFFEEKLTGKSISEKERLTILYKDLKDLKVNSLSDLENLIAKAE